MSCIRIRVQLSDNKPNNSYNRKPAPPPLKFLYVLDSSSTKTIAELIHLLENYIKEQISNANIEIVQLMTDDGYILSNYDICSNVLKDNDRIVCVDMEKFLQENYSSLDLENLWCEIKQHEASDNQEKYIKVGLNNSGKLFLRMYGTSDIYGLYLFSLFELRKIVQDKRQNNVIARLDNTNDYGETSSDWFIEAKWDYDSSSDTFLFLICNLKIASSEQIWSNKLRLLLDQSPMHIGKGELIYLSGEATNEFILNDQQRERLQELAAKIPSPKRTGPEIDVDLHPNKKLTKHECEGESFVQMANGNTNTVTTYQESRSSSDEVFRQHFVISHIVFSKKPKASEQKQTISIEPISVSTLTVFYQTDDESWHECQDVAIAPITIRNEEPRWLTDSVIHIESDKFISFAIQGWFTVKGKIGNDNNTRRRLHKSLPQPFKLKISIMDNYNKQSSLIVEQLNKPLEFDTRESFHKCNQSSMNDLLAFIYADNCESDERIFSAVYLNKENELVIKSGHMFSITLDRNNIRTMEFNAKQNNTTEVSFDSLYYQHDTQEKKAIGLFDPETFIFYAIRFEISTKTSKTEETVFLPIEKIKY